MEDFYISKFEKELKRHNINFIEDVKDFTIDCQYIVFTMKNNDKKTFFVGW